MSERRAICERDDYLRVIATSAEAAKRFLGAEITRQYGEPVDLGPPDPGMKYRHKLEARVWGFPIKNA